MPSLYVRPRSAGDCPLKARHLRAAGTPALHARIDGRTGSPDHGRPPGHRVAPWFRKQSVRDREGMDRCGDSRRASMSQTTTIVELAGCPAIAATPSGDSPNPIPVDSGRGPWTCRQDPADHPDAPRLLIHSWQRVHRLQGGMPAHREPESTSGESSRRHRPGSLRSGTPRSRRSGPSRISPCWPSRACAGSASGRTRIRFRQQDARSRKGDRWRRRSACSPPANSGSSLSPSPRRHVSPDKKARPPIRSGAEHEPGSSRSSPQRRRSETHRAREIVWSQHWPTSGEDRAPATPATRCVPAWR